MISSRYSSQVRILNSKLSATRHSAAIIREWRTKCQFSSQLWARLALTSSTLTDNCGRVFGHWKLEFKILTWLESWELNNLCWESFHIFNVIKLRENLGPIHPEISLVIMIIKNHFITGDNDLWYWRALKLIYYITYYSFDPGGPVVIILASGSKIRGFDPGQDRWIFSERNNPEHDFLLKGSKAVGPML